MEEQIKKLEHRDDGFVEVTLKRVKDFDDYVFAQIGKDPLCLPCIRDPKSKLKLFYDRKGYLDLLTYLKGHVFEKEEVLAFLMYVCERLVQANTQKPVYLQSDLIFLSYDGRTLKFLALPLTMDKWVFQSEQSKQFLKELIMELQTTDGYESIGLLVETAKQKEVAFPSLLQHLLQLQGQHEVHQPWYRKWFGKQQKTDYVIRDVPKPLPIMEPSYPESVDMETMVLFGGDQTTCFVDQQNNQVYVVMTEYFTIGRSRDSQLCLNDNFVSAKHATYCKSTGILIDHGSSNGTLVNNEKIKEIALRHGDIVSFADHEFEFKEKMG